MTELHYVSGVFIEVKRHYGNERPTFVTDGEVIRRAKTTLPNLPKGNTERADKGVG